MPHSKEQNTHKAEDQNNFQKLHYIDPNTKNYIEYYDHLIAFNQTSHKRLATDLEQQFHDMEKEIAIAIVGSDARLEKGPISQIELVIYSDAGIHSKEFGQKIKEFIKKKENAPFFDQNIEEKHIDKEKVSSFMQKNTNDVRTRKFISPNRVFDAVRLFGNEYILNKGKNKLITEINGTMYYDIRQKLKSHKETTQTGQNIFKSAKINHYDLDAGIANYNPEKYIQSFKLGPIRLIQYAIIRDYIREIKQKKEIKEILELPKNTVQKLNTIEVEGLTILKSDQIKVLTDCYKFFCWIYHKSQDQYYQKQKTEIGFDNIEVKERINNIIAICNHPILTIKY